MATPSPTSASGPVARAGQRQVDLLLADGRVWPLVMTRGCEQFVGRYARLPGIRSTDPWLRFRDGVDDPAGDVC